MIKTGKLLHRPKRNQKIDNNDAVNRRSGQMETGGGN